MSLNLLQFQSMTTVNNIDIIEQDPGGNRRLRTALDEICTVRTDERTLRA